MFRFHSAIRGQKNPNISVISVSQLSGWLWYQNRHAAGPALPCHARCEPRAVSGNHRGWQRNKLHVPTKARHPLHPPPIGSNGCPTRWHLALSKWFKMSDSQRWRKNSARKTSWQRSNENTPFPGSILQHTMQQVSAGWQHVSLTLVAKWKTRVLSPSVCCVPLFRLFNS